MLKYCNKNTFEKTVQKRISVIFSSWNGQLLVQDKKRAVRLAGGAENVMSAMVKLLCSRYGQIKKKENKKSWDAVKTAPQANGVENGKISCWR